MLLAFVGLKWGCERSLTEAGPWERQHTLHHPCHMLASCPSDCALNCAMWLLQTKESGAAGLSVVEIELLATVGWKPGCQPFSCPSSENVTQYAPVLQYACILPIPWYCSYGKQHLSHAEKQSVWSRSCGLQDFFLVAQCCPFALFGCIPLFAWTRLNFIAG